MPKKGPSSIDERLRRIEGQVRGIEKMYISNSDVEQLLIQIQAVVSSLESVKVELLKKDIKKKLLESIDKSIDLIKL